MRRILISLMVVLTGIVSLQAQVSDSSKRTNSRRPTINQSQAKPGSKEMLEIELNKNRNKGAQTDSSRSATIPAFDGGTSSAGSPSELSGDNGKQRDGTNTVQRSSYNMAGSPPPRKSARAAHSLRAGKSDENNKAENKSADTDKSKKKSKKKDKD